MTGAGHQYIERDTGRICSEKLYGDRFVKLLYKIGRAHV